MNKTEFIRAVAQKSDTTIKQTEMIFESVITVITEELKKGEKIVFQGFGIFEPKYRAERKGINPLTKQKIKIAATTVPSFRAGKNFKEEMKKMKTKKAK